MLDCTDIVAAYTFLVLNSAMISAKKKMTVGNLKQLVQIHKKGDNYGHVQTQTNPK